MTAPAIDYATEQRRRAIEVERALRARRPRRLETPAAYADWLAGARPEHRWDYPHFQAMQAVLDGATAGTIRRAYVSIPIRHGKALALDTPIPTPDGFKLMGELVVGDTVFADDGQPCTVTAVSGVFKDRPVYRVTSDDGYSVVADAAHEWPVAITPGMRRGVGRGRLTDKSSGRAISIRETEWLARRQAKTGRAVFSPLAGPAQTAEAALPVDPYVLGAWLGDGHSHGGQFTVGGQDRAHLETKLRAAGYDISWMPSGETDRGGGCCTALGLRGQLVALGVLENKHIPASYLRASVRQRTALLQGLVDTDGYVSPTGQVEFSAVREGLARQVQELVWSLGRKASLITSRATIDGRDCGTCYRVSFYMSGAATIPRKAARCRDAVSRLGRYLSVEYLGTADTLCIEVSSPTHLFLCGRAMLPTHNSEHNTIGYAVYRLERDPKTRVIVASYNQRQADKFSREIRRLARARGVALSTERDAAGEWETAAGGGVRAVGAGAGLASVNADLILIDDPIGSREDAESPAHRDRVWDWLTSDVLARAEPRTAVLMTMSRWHQDDPAGRLLDQQGGNWHILDLPARAEPNDPLGRAEHEPLWPEFRSAGWLDEKMVELLPYGFASLLQGRPRPREGGMFKWDWWQLVDSIPAIGPMVRYWDMAGTRQRGKGHDPDYTAGALLTRTPEGRIVIADMARFRVEVAARDAHIVAQAQQDRAAYQGRVTYWLEAQAGISGEDATAAVLRQLHAIGITAYAERPTGDKTERARPLASAALAGNVLLGPGAWRDAFRAEAADFPHGKHDDQIDAAAGALAKLATPTPAVGFFRPSL